MAREPDGSNGAAVATAEESPAIEVTIENPLEGLPEEYDTGPSNDELSPHEGLPTPGEESTDEPSEEAAEQEVGDVDEGQEQAKTDTEIGETLDPDLVGIARRLGMPDATIASLGTSQRLAGFLQGVTESRLQATTKQQQDGQPPVVGDKSGAQVFELGLDPEELDERVIDAFERLNQHHQSQISEMRGELDMISRSAQAEIAKQKVAVFDHTVGQLGETFESVLGKGDIEAIQRGSLQFQARARLEKTAMALEESLGIPFDDAVRRAAHALHYDLAQKAARTELRNKVNTQGKHVAPRRTGSPKGHIDPDREALQNISEKLRSWGYG